MIPFAVLKSETPNTAKESFLSGRSFVTTKDKAFEPSDPFHLGAELASIITAEMMLD